MNWHVPYLSVSNYWHRDLQTIRMLVKNILHLARYSKENGILALEK